LPVVLVLLGQQLAGALIVGAVVLASAEALPSGRVAGLSLVAGLTGALALGAFYRALAVGTMSIVAPISASGVAVPVVAGVVGGDRPTTLQAAGLAVTVVGVLLASREVHEDAEPGRSGRLSIGLALLAALGFGAYFTLTDAVAEDSILWLLLLGRAAAVSVLLAVVLVTRPRARPVPRQLAALATIGALDLAATGLYALATTEGLLSVVAVVGSLYPVATVLLARAVLKERLRREQQAGVALALAGVAAVAAG
ncbi:MAG TPA: EamA family transporter, partial [Solirubrobacteraceae bacterium]|nr:EamA family transporter [Solirubrobacteraceae bacterium]